MRLSVLLCFILFFWITPTKAGLTFQSRSVNSAEDPTISNKKVSVPKSSSDAAMRNKASSDDLKWTFGGKQHQGWTIYIPLICDTVGAATDIESDDFARAVAGWQVSRSLSPSGVIDNETWSKMIGEFQSRRIQQRNYPPDEELVVVQESEFYDPTRPAELRRVDKAAYSAYRRMVAAAVKDDSLGLRVTPSGELDSAEKYLKIISAFRSREYQNQLRQSSPRAGRLSLAVNSPHFTGRALDLYVGGQPVSTVDRNRLIQTDTPIYKWLVRNAAKFGFRPYFYEPWHWEYVP